MIFLLSIDNMLIIYRFMSTLKCDMFYLLSSYTGEFEDYFKIIYYLIIHLNISKYQSSQF